VPRNRKWTQGRDKILWTSGPADTARPGGEAAPLQRCRTVLHPPPTAPPGSTSAPPLINAHPPLRPQFIGSAIRCNVTLPACHTVCQKKRRQTVRQSVRSHKVHYVKWPGLFVVCCCVGGIGGCLRCGVFSGGHCNIMGPYATLHRCYGRAWLVLRPPALDLSLRD
jgi:hypothetical protein